MLEGAFIKWLLEGYEEGSLSKDEIELALADRKVAYRMLLEFIEGDWKEIGELAQIPIRRCKEKLKI
jgi:hypothetical protein